MKKMSFNIGNYSFPNKLDKLIQYLVTKNIENKINENNIEFSFYLDDICLNFIGEIYKNRISCFKGYLEKDTSENIIKVERYIKSIYTKKDELEESTISYYKVYRHKDFPEEHLPFQIEIILVKEPEFLLTVRFEDDNHKAFDYKIKRKLFFERTFIIFSALIGLGISILFFWLNSRNRNITTVTITSMLSYIYMALVLYYLSLIIKEPKKKAILNALLIPIVYISIGFIVLLFVKIDNISGNPIVLLDNLLWTIFSMPAFIIVTIIALLFCVGY